MHAGPAPLPRGGHVAAMQDHSVMVMHGGHSEVYGSFSDVWLFDVGAQRWTPAPPATSAQPAARSHHGATLWDGRLFVFGGQFGAPAGAAGCGRPLGDRWYFQLDSRTWTQLPVRGIAPLPRYTFASALRDPGDGSGPRLVLFGGQTGGRAA